MDGFRNRADAGRALASRLREEYAGRDDVLVVGLPRGGVPVAAEVADVLGAPLDVLVVRKLGVPGHRELAMGAIASGGAEVRNQTIIDRLGIGEPEIARVATERAELERRERFYRDGRPPIDPAARTVIVVDDGLATGASMRSAVTALRSLGPASVVVAVPVGAPETCRDLERVADGVVCAVAPISFYAVGQWYDDFRQTTDDEVRRLLSDGAIS